MSDIKKYLGKVGHLPNFGKVTVVAVIPSYLLVRLDESKQGWRADHFSLMVRIEDITGVRKDDVGLLPLDNIFNNQDGIGYFWWVDTTLESGLELFSRKKYVKDLEELAELEQEKKAKESFKRGAGHQWSHQRHDAARAILGVRKSRW